MKDKRKRRPPAIRDATHPAVQTSCLDGGAQWDALDPGGRDALWVAGMKGHDEIVALLEAKAAAPGGRLPDVH